MNTDVIISVRGVQMLMEEQSPIEIISRGKLYRRNGKTFVKYDEIDEENNIIHCVIKYDDASMQIRRNGEHGNTCMVFELDKSCITTYNTPVGSMIMGFTTKEFDIIRDERAEFIRVKYMLDINYSYIADCFIEIKIVAADN